MNREEATAKLETIAAYMEANICLIDRIVKALPSNEKFLDDQLCSVIGAYMAVHNTLKMMLRAASDPTVGQYSSNIEMFLKSIEQTKVVEFRKPTDAEKRIGYLGDVS